jgi:hypothetical protein
MTRLRRPGIEISGPVAITPMMINALNTKASTRPH